MADQDANNQNQQLQVNGQQAQGGEQQQNENGAKLQEKAPANPKKKRRLVIIAATVALVAVIGGLLWWLHARNYEDTDDAQVDGHLHPIASRVDGTVVTVHVEDNQPVHKGDLLVELDPKDYAVSLDKAKASYQQAVAQTQVQNPNLPITRQTNTTNVSTGQAEVANADAALAAAEHDQTSATAQLEQANANNERAQKDLARYTRLLERDEVSKQAYDQYLATAKAQSAAVSQQEAALRAAAKVVDQRRAQLQEQQERLRQSQINAPNQVAIQQAQNASSKADAASLEAEMKQSALNLGYTKICSPVDGIATQRSAESGGKVSTGQQLMMVVEANDMWVTANFRETQLRKMRNGQRVKIHVDTLDEDFDGYVQNMPAASGDRTSVLPPENATGNYVKVVQRLGVRIAFYPGQRDLNLLRPGMSVEPNVDIR